MEEEKDTCFKDVIVMCVFLPSSQELKVQECSRMSQKFSLRRVEDKHLRVKRE